MNAVMAVSVALFVVVAVFVYATRKRTGGMQPPVMVSRPIPLTNEEAQSQVVAYINSGQKINAIKVYREHTGVGLKEAKDIVEAMESRMNAGMSPSFDEVGGWGSLSAPAAASPISNLEEAGIRSMLSQNQKINAIELYREQYNCDLVTAKNAVEAIEREMKMGR